MKAETVYVKPEKNTEVYDHRVAVGQIAQVHCRNAELEKRCNDQILLEITEKTEAVYTGSILDIVRKLHQIDDDLEVINLGEKDFLISFVPQKRMIGIEDYLKTAFIALIVFLGAAFAIMTFNEDGNVTGLFQRIYRWMTGESPKGVTALEIGYSLGMTVGVILFFNHFSKHKFSMDPTPIEVQMRLYEDEVYDTMIQNASRTASGVDKDTIPQISKQNQGGTG